MPAKGKGGAKKDECVKVIVRSRPMAKYELERKCKSVLTFNHKAQAISIRNPEEEGQAPKTFTFDGVFDHKSTQKGVYELAAVDLVDAVIDGYNGTVFAYGQTGCGKTFTMEGVRTDPVLRGIIPNSFEQIFEHIETADESKNVTYLVSAAYLEIYNEKVRDLLNPTGKSLDLKESKEKGVYVQGLSHTVVKSEEETFVLMESGNKNRAVSSTAMNAVSSRSHSIFIVTIETSEPRPPDKETGEEQKPMIKSGTLNLVDLAGSERQSKTKAEGARLKEANSINVSLSALGNVISALVAGKGKHIPYRDSKLTRLLQSSLGGNAKTVMIAALSPADYNYEETLTTLRYANRAKQIKNKPVVNMDPKDALLQEYQQQIQQLKAMLEAQASGGGGGGADLQAMMAKMSEGGGNPLAKSGPVAAQMESAKKEWEEEKLRMEAEKKESAARAANLAEQMELAKQDRERIEKEREEIRLSIEQEKYELEQELHAKEEEVKKKVEEAKKSADSALIEKEKAMAEALRAERDEQQKLIEELNKKKHVESELLEHKKKQEELAKKLAEQETVVANKLKMEQKRQELLAKELEDVSNAFLAKQKKSKKKESKLLRAIDEIKKNEEASKALSAKIMEEKKRYEEKNNQLADELKRKDRETEEKVRMLEEQTLKDKEELKMRMKQMEESLIQGGKRTKDIEAQHKKKLAKEARKRKEEQAERVRLEKEKSELQNKRVFLEEQYESLQEEVVDTKKKCKILIDKYQTLEQENQDLIEEAQTEKEELLDGLREEVKKAMLYQMIAQTVLTEKDLDKIVSQSVYDEESEKWKLPSVTLPIFFPDIGKSSTSQSKQLGADSDSARSSAATSRANSRTNSAKPRKNPANMQIPWNMSRNNIRDAARDELRQMNRREERDRSRSRSRPRALHRSNASRNQLEMHSIKADTRHINELMAKQAAPDPLMQAINAKPAFSTSGLQVDDDDDQNLIPDVTLPSRPSFQPAFKTLVTGDTGGHEGNSMEDMLGQVPLHSKPAFQGFSNPSMVADTSSNETPSYLDFQPQRKTFNQGNDLFANRPRGNSESSTASDALNFAPAARPRFEAAHVPQHQEKDSTSSLLDFNPMLKPKFEVAKNGLDHGDDQDQLSSALDFNPMARPQFNASQNGFQPSAQDHSPALSSQLLDFNPSRPQFENPNIAPSLVSSSSSSRLVESFNPSRPTFSVDAKAQFSNDNPALDFPSFANKPAFSAPRPPDNPRTNSGGRRTPRDALLVEEM